MMAFGNLADMHSAISAVAKSFAPTEHLSPFDHELHRARIANVGTLR
jgi:hypothetical protein